MPDLVGGDGDGRQGSTVHVVARQPNGLVLRVVVVADVGFLDPDLAQARLVEKMSGQFAAGARKVRPVVRMAGHDPPRPEGRPEDSGGEQEGEDNEVHS